MKFLSQNDRFIVDFVNGNPIPDGGLVIDGGDETSGDSLEIVDTDPGLKGDTAGTGGKPATLSTGAVVKVPLFVQIGEVIKVDTRSGEYVSRVK